jgi:tetratricopeptide (TPR) repeat protein
MNTTFLENKTQKRPSGILSDLPAPFLASDRIAFLITFFITLILYLYTLNPTVALEDSGELITGAAVFGVPHPPGYPLWSFLGFLSTLAIPVGGIAWKLNVMSAVFGAAANGLVALLVSHSGRWLLERMGVENASKLRIWPFYAGITSGSLLGFSAVMWSQSVYAEVFTLNALILTAVLVCVYRWCRQPDSQRWLLAGIFVYCMGLTHHHTLIFAAPALILFGFFVNRALFPTFLTAVALLSLSVFSWICGLSDNPQLYEIQRRVAYVVLFLVGLMAFWWTREFRFRRMASGALAAALLCWWISFFASTDQYFVIAGWKIKGPDWVRQFLLGDGYVIQTAAGIKFILFAATIGAIWANSVLNKKLTLAILAVGWLGLTPYSYLPVASSTNPPMNWAYARERRGFFHSISRGQYPNNLSGMIKSTFGRAVGIRQAEEQPKDIKTKIDYVTALIRAIKQYYRSLEGNFTLPICLLAFPLLLYVAKLESSQIRWLLFLLVLYTLLVTVQSILEPPSTLDNITVWVLRRFFLQSHCLLAVGIGYGVIASFHYLDQKNSMLPVTAAGMVLFIALLPLTQNIHICNQRYHWFGWYYGAGILGPLEKNAVYIGGTDPGRFIPTYMIFCESQQPARWKLDPGFDRRDVFVLTQNALADDTYMKYLRDQYDSRQRKKPSTVFEKWLGRAAQYPERALTMPTDSQFWDCYASYMKELHAKQKNGSGTNVDIMQVNARILKLIFNENKNQHPFYYEESIPIKWVYDHMLPAGLVCRLNPEPVKTLPRHLVEKDFAFWKAYSSWLKSNPFFWDDPPARRAFAKLRGTYGNLYRHHGMTEEADRAFQEALELYPLHEEVIQCYADFLASQEKLHQLSQLLETLTKLDPRSEFYRSLRDHVRRIRQTIAKANDLKEYLQKNPNHFDTRLELAVIFYNLGKFKEASVEIEKTLQIPALDAEQTTSIMRVAAAFKAPEEMLELLKKRLKIAPRDAGILYNTAAYMAELQKNKEALVYLEKAIQVSPDIVKAAIVTDARFNGLRGNLEFQRMAKRLQETKN